MKKRFGNACKFFYHRINEFILLLEKSIYPYRYKKNWEKFIEASLPEKEDFEMKNLGEYHDMFVQSDTLFSAVLFET